MKPRIIAIVGPTAVGKSDLAVRLAKAFNGEVVSADSRQVYRGLNIGTGKMTRREMRGVRHHLLDVLIPRNQFSVADYKIRAELSIDEILARGKLPILCGGTGQYVDAVAHGHIHPSVPPDITLRRSLEKMSVPELYSKLERIDPARADKIEANNPRRLIRAIEIAVALGRVPRLKSAPKYEALMIGITMPRHVLRSRIRSHLLERMRHGMLAEARRLHKNGLSWKRMDELGLEYRYLSQHLRGRMSYDEMIAKLEVEIWRYAKRQMTWFRKNREIMWHARSKRSSIHNLIRKFIGDAAIRH